MADPWSDADAEGIEERETDSIAKGKRQGLTKPKAKGGKQPKGLTHKQDRFATLVAAGETQADAYRMAYDAEGMTDDTVYGAASSLMRDSRIAARATALQAVKLRLDWQNTTQLKELAVRTLVDEAQGQGPDTKSSARIAAAVAIGKMTEVDLFTDHKVVEHVDNRQLAALTTKLEQRLKALFVKAQSSPVEALPRPQQAEEPDPGPGDPTEGGAPV